MMNVDGKDRSGFAVDDLRLHQLRLTREMVDGLGQGGALQVEFRARGAVRQEVIAAEVTHVHAITWRERLNMPKNVFQHIVETDDLPPCGAGRFVRNGDVYRKHRGAGENVLPHGVDVLR